MTIARGSSPPWLLFVFNLPSKQASARVEIWRKLKKMGALPLETSGYLLPNRPGTQEHFEWLAANVRKYGGEASVAHVAEFDRLPYRKLRQLFLEARNNDYRQIIEGGTQLSKGQASIRLSSLRRRLHEVIASDFFGSPLRRRAEQVLNQHEKTPVRTKKAIRRRDFRNRTWITRPRPGIDRCASAWLIRRFIDPKPRFVFGKDSGKISGAIPFDMFGEEGFGHRGDDCTFETLCREFSIHDAKVNVMAQIIHDADLGDEKFGRNEGAGLERVLGGWARQRISDLELLRRGMELMEALYSGL
jgi:hypothetical protein